MIRIKKKLKQESKGLKLRDRILTAEGWKHKLAALYPDKFSLYKKKKKIAVGKKPEKS